MTYGRNIAKYWRGVSPDDVAAGEVAYSSYNWMMRQIACTYGVPVVTVTEVFAALSPNNDYLGNLRSAVSLIEGVQQGRPYTITTYKACGLRAEAYLRGEVSFMDTVKGPKIRAFRNCILDPDNCPDFVLDGHMVAIALGRKLTMSQANLELQKLSYHKIAAAYIRAARKRLMLPSALQAALWYSRKRRERILFTDQRDLWWDDYRLIYPMSDIQPYKRSEATWKT